MDAIEDELRNLMGPKQRGLEERKDQLTSEGKDTLRIVGHINNGFKVVQASFDLYKKFSADLDKLDEIAKSRLIEYR